MANNHIQNGSRIAFVNTTGSAIASGDLVPVGAMICVAAVDIADTETGTCITEGVFELPKVSGATLAQGEAAVWDKSAGAIAGSGVTQAAGDIAGSLIVWEAAGSGTATVKVKLAGPGIIKV